MKLILFSGGEYQENKRLNKELFRLSGVKSPVMVYIPSENNEHPKYFSQWKKFYLNQGASKCLYFPLKKRHAKETIKMVFEADIIFLSGGNTFTFLNNLNKSGLKKDFFNFIKRGGVLAGMSAGSILMTPSIHMAEIPGLDPDENEVRIKNFKALNLVNFDFSPHYEYDHEGDFQLKRYSKEKKRTVIGCEDGAGLIIEGKKIKRHGVMYKFFDGKKEKIKEPFLTYN